MKRRYTNFDILRLFLALEVVGLHALQIPKGGFHFYAPIPPVATFVCLSGLLIPDSFGASRSWRHFAWKRILRIVPALLLSFVLVLVLFGPSRLWPIITVYLTAGLFALPSVNGALWSLMLEEVLYLHHGICRSVKGWWNVRTAIACLVGSWTFWLAARWWLDRDIYRQGLPPDMHMAPVCAFFAGCILSFHKEWIRSLPWKPVLFTLAISTALLWTVPILGVALSPLTCVLAVILAFCAPQVRWKAPDLSYGLYIYGTPLIVWAAYHRQWTAWPVLGFTLAIGFALAALSWYLVEKPALTLKDWRPTHRADLLEEQSPVLSSEPTTVASAQA